MSSEPTIQARVLYGFADFLARDDVVLDQLLERIGIQDHADDLILADETMPLAKVIQLFELAAEATESPCFGLEYADQMEVGVFGSLGFLMIHAPSVRDALENLCHYTATSTRPAPINLSIDAAGMGELSWSYPSQLPASLFQYASFTAAVVIKRLQVIAGDTWTPLRVDLMHREPPCPDLYRKVFGERARFNQPRNAFLIDPTTMARKSTTANPHLYAAVRIAANTELAMIKSTHDTVQLLRRTIQQRLTNNAPSLEEIADAMGYKKPRQLQWKLEQEGTTFEKELAETRRQLAERLLATTDLTMTQIAAAVGFSELSSFTRAAKQWFGVSPSEYRMSVRAVPRKA